MSNQPEESFLQKNFEYYQAWHHWLRKAVKLKRAALILYRADLPDLRLYDKAYKKAEKEVGQEGKALIRHRHPDMLPAFSMFGSALESLFKGLMVGKSPGLIGAHKLSPSLKSHDLVQLSKDAGVKLNAPETRLLAWLSGCDLEGPVFGSNQYQVRRRLLPPFGQHEFGRRPSLHQNPGDNIRAHEKGAAQGKADI
jgi:hypothetical protein